ncbi:hypothetical protein C8Q74DRAFT_1364018 [Fomes fomentarius]|nr:hypothetical protein C8Q74DRAFT_1364018 [Fomes fomentarius]
MANTRNNLPREARDMRLEAYANGRIINEEQKEKLYQDIKAIPGTERYNRHTHSNFCTKQEREQSKPARVEIRRRLGFKPNPTMLDIFIWSLEMRITASRAITIVYELVRDELMADAKLQTEIDQLMNSALMPTL